MDSKGDMRGLRTEFYADHNDLLVLLGVFERLLDIKYVESLSGLNQKLRVLSTSVEVMERAVINPDKPAVRPIFLLFDTKTAPFPEVTVMADGSGQKESLGQSLNPDSLVLRIGGDVGDNTLVMSDLGTLGESIRSREMYEAFRKAIEQQSKRVGPKGKPCRLMPGAIARLKAGWRIAREKSQPAWMDPKVSDEEMLAL